MIEFVKGDIFSQDVEALVNPINCVGVMGKGLALEFKNRYNKNFEIYKIQCNCKLVKIGNMLVTQVSEKEKGNSNLKYIVNFPTKVHWKNQSKIEYIDLGLKSLENKINELQINSVAIPAIGCGNGGLKFKEVKPLIVSHLKDLNAKIIVVE